VQASRSITEREMRDHVNFLASDLLEGRDSGQRGAEIAALYIAEQFESSGLEPLFGDQWQMPFDLPGAAGKGRARVTLGDREVAGESLLSVPSMSAVGRVEARACTIEGDVKDAVVVVAADRSGARTIAQDLFKRGAVAVVLLSDEQFLSPESDFDMRRIDGQSRGGRNGATVGLESLPEEMRKQLEEQLGLKPGQVQVRFAGGEPEGGERERQSRAVPGGRETFKIAGPGELFASRRLSGPVVWAAQALADQILATAQAEETLSLDVSRSGSDRSANVIGICRGSDPQLRNEYVVVGAHYDHIGFDDRGHIWNGADDNASGTAAVLAMARALATMPLKPRRSIVLAAWSAEERGLIGSRAFAAAAPIPFDKMAAYVNLDMISRNDARSIEVLTASDDLKRLAEERVAAQGMQAVEGNSQYLAQSDTVSFIEHEVPTVFFFCGVHEDYHRASDDPQKIDAAKAARVAEAAFEVTLAVANASERPQFTKTAMGSLFNIASQSKRLGIFPAQSSQEEGVLVDRVNVGGVGDKAGVQAGDRIVRIATTKIGNLAEMRRVLEEQAEGKPFAIEVVRKAGSGAEEKVVLEGVFPARNQ
jgi:Iap family predicted aminopeptidase